MDHCIVYFSQSTATLNDVQIEAILTESRLRNAQTHITGVLIYVRGGIMQVLEGPCEAVKTLCNRIEADPRHTNLTRVFDRPVTQRLFSRWSMGYETTTDQQLDTIRVLIDLDHTDGPDEITHQPILLKLIKVFYQSNRFN